ncbi:MAG TPA: iron-containing alcohol dehydrogenase [Geminicoccus sp.]|jgi:alcohol dehydrogenase|uniref:iron-containing alcohol dehydrogenase n=1 Tax=Geminicoccus sp. TaxID=2024832 RepID=UPI002E37A973|nr:iron-containing alcohol dehydrogenase [Geminicoccus sp.]HEX2525815.1 iron-containing alcohol dehydrogenase [Geminicoccus sp.]
MPDFATLSTAWNYPTRVLFGAGAVAKLAESCKAAGMKRPLVVTDPGIVKLPILTAVLDALKAGGLEAAVFSEVKPNPVAKNVSDGIAVLREGRHDGVVAFGGGSGLDAGKVVAFMAGQTRPMWDFEDIEDWWTRADPNGIAPIVAIPTTAGTGSEVGRAGVITDERTHTKKIIFHPKMMPSTAILDAQMTVGLPKNLTAWTGFDALAHCLEAYCAPGFHPMAEGIAVEGMRLVKEALPKAVADGSDLEARGKMLVASAMGATAFQKGLGAIHSLSHPVGAIYDTHHGLTNAVFMPYVLAFNRDVITDRMERLSAWLGLSGSSGYDAVLQWVLRLREELGVPNTLAGLDVGAERFEEMGKMAEQDPTAGSNPRPLTAADAVTLFENALAGKL